jgi:hypothetical protein
MLKIIAVIANVAWLVLVYILLGQNGIPRSAWDAFVVSLMTITPTINLVAFYFSTKNESWIGLYLKRKALEERKRIDNLDKGE